MPKLIPKPEKTWAQLLTELKEAGISQTAVAEHCGCSKSSISELVNEVAKRDPGYTVGFGILQLHKRHVKT